MSKGSAEGAMRIVMFGAGMQGTLYGVRLARAGHTVRFVARGPRAAELRARGAAIREALSGRGDVVHLPVDERLGADVNAELCFVTVRREQLDAALVDLAAAAGIGRFVFMVNNAAGSQAPYAALGRARVVLAFPGAAGGLDGGVDHYVEVAEQPTTIDASARDVAATLRGAGFRVALVTDMDSWLRRHAVFVTAIGGALWRVEGDTRRLASDAALVRTFIVAVREGWGELDRIGAAPAPPALRAIFAWVPLPLAVRYWRRLLRSPRGEFYFGRHTRHAPRELAALAADVRTFTRREATVALTFLFDALDEAAAKYDSTR